MGGHLDACAKHPRNAHEHVITIPDGRPDAPMGSGHTGVDAAPNPSGRKDIAVRSRTRGPEAFNRGLGVGNRRAVHSDETFAVDAIAADGNGIHLPSARDRYAIL